MKRTAKTENGTVRGLQGTDARITVYKGIPFAAPPTGQNRWRAPQPVKNWEGVRDCFSYAPISVQDVPGLSDDLYCREWHVDPDIPMDEDCLYLNIWTPAVDQNEKLPVLVVYFGGAFQWGYTAEMEYDGERLAARGIVVVTVNYRLGAFGFLSHPDITEEAPDAPGNFGLLDQQAGLKWVSRNIASFGGDPDRIFIEGQSAGGCSVLNQLACEENYGIIKGAVILSGIIRFSEAEKERDLFLPPTLSEAEKRGEDFFSYLGVKTLGEARALDAVTIREKYAKYREDHPFFANIIDGKFMKDDPLVRFMNGDCAHVPVMAGNTADEFSFGGENVVERSVKEVFQKVLENRKDAKLYYYRFNPDIPGKDAPGSFHSCDLWFFFETLQKCRRAYVGHHYDLARQMCNYLAAFIKNNDAGADDRSEADNRSEAVQDRPALCCEDADGSMQPAWKPYTLAERNEMNFVSEGCVPGIETNRPKQIYNPYMPLHEFVPDGEPHVFGDRVYVYGSHDLYDGVTFCPGDYVCYSAPVTDLKSWRYEGVIYGRCDDPVNRDGRMCLYAPDVTKGPDGRYYLYYVYDKVDYVSVAVCDTPAGNYKFYGYVKYPDGTLLGRRAGDEPQFDPGVLTEGNVTYLYTGFAGHEDAGRHGAMFTVLDADMLTVVKEPAFIVPNDVHAKGTEYEGHAFFEAPSIRKKDNTYYFIYSSEVMHELCYAISDRPEGPFTYGGVIISNSDIGIGSYKDAALSMAYGANNHGGIEEIGGKWYIFYHRHTNGTWYSRQGCAEEIAFSPDGKIPQVALSSCGLNGGPLSDTGEYPAAIVCHLFNEKHDVYIGDEGAPRVKHDGYANAYAMPYIANIRNGVTAGFRSFSCKGVTGVKIKARGYFKGDFHIRMGWDQESIGRISVDYENVWTAYETKVAIPDGVQDLYLTFEGDGTGQLLSFEFIHGA